MYGNIIHIEIGAQPQTNLTKNKSFKKSSILLVLLFYLVFFK